MVKRSEPNIAILAGPHFGRLAATAGFLYGYVEAYESRELPKPKRLIGTSSGGINAGAFTPFTMEAAEHNWSKIRALKGEDFYGLNKELEALGLIEALGAVTPFIPWERIQKRWLRILAKSAVSASFLAAEGAFIYALFACRSIFTNDKLVDLLEGHFNLDDIFNSDIKTEITATDINGDQALNKNVALSSVTNFKHEDVNLPQKERDMRFLMGTVTGASIPGFFQTRQNAEGHFLTDGAIYSAFPINLAYDDGCDVIVIIKLQYASQGYLEHDYSKWMSALHRSTDILIDNYSDTVLRGYLNINNDIVQIARIREMLAKLEAAARFANGTIRSEIESSIADIERRLSYMTAHEKRYVNIVVIDSDEIPEMDFRHCSQESNEKALELGYKALKDSKDIVLQAIDDRA